MGTRDECRELLLKRTMNPGSAWSDSNQLIRLSFRSLREPIGMRNSRLIQVSESSMWHGHLARVGGASVCLSRCVALVFCLLIIVSAMNAQQRGPHQLIVPLTDGGFVAFQVETAFSTPSKTADNQQTRAIFDSQALVDD